MAHKHNHFVPAFMLRYWRSYDEKRRIGVHVFHVADRRYEWDRQVGKNATVPFRFAALDDLYVPVVAGRRHLSLEEGWLAEQERELSKIVEKAHRKQEVTIRGRQSNPVPALVRAFKVREALFALHARSPDIIKIFQDLVEAKPDLRPLLGADPADDSKQVALHNLVMLAQKSARDMACPKYAFIHGPEGTFILGDRPVFQANELGWFAVLTDKVAVNFVDGLDPMGESITVDVADGIQDIINEQVALQARRWIVAKDKDQLLRYAEKIGTPEWHENWKNLEIGYIDLPERIPLLRIKERAGL